MLLGKIFLASAGETVSEFQTKAALLPKLAAFVDWPEAAFATTNAPIKLGLLGEFPPDEDFTNALRHRTAHGRSFLVAQLTNVSNAMDCHILFISPKEALQVTNILNAVAGKPILTVGDQTKFTEAGGMINFSKRDSKVCFEINALAANHSGLKISSKLLQVARDINAPPVRNAFEPPPATRRAHVPNN